MVGIGVLPIPSTLYSGRLSWKILLIIPLTGSPGTAHQSTSPKQQWSRFVSFPGRAVVRVLLFRRRFCTGMSRAGSSLTCRGCVFCPSPIPLLMAYSKQLSQPDLVFWIIREKKESSSPEVSFRVEKKIIIFLNHSPCKCHCLVFLFFSD